MGSRAWNVYHNGKLFDTVWFAVDCDHDYVKRALIDHDGYPVDITIKKGK
jgi:hypothetical protein